MGWQKCPVCNGKGTITAYIDYTPYSYNIEKCNTCNGRGIINELTGKAVE